MAFISVIHCSYHCHHESRVNYVETRKVLWYNGKEIDASHTYATMHPDERNMSEDNRVDHEALPLEDVCSARFSLNFCTRGSAIGFFYDCLLACLKPACVRSKAIEWHAFWVLPALTCCHHKPHRSTEGQ
jgi:hypothetical protein